MVEKIILYSSTDDILKRYTIAINDYTLPIFTHQETGNGLSTYVITSESNHELQRMKFGFTPHWAKDSMNLLTARAEGDKNVANDPFYNGPNSIFLKPAFKKAIQHYRCLVVADGFICQSSGKQLPIYLTEKPSVLAGIYDYWIDPLTKIPVPGFALVTVPSSGMLREVGIQRMPVVLSYFNCANWIKPERPLSYYLPMLNRSLNEITSQLSLSPEGNKSIAPLKPVALRDMYHEMHKSKRERRGPPEGPGWGELIKLNRENQNTQ